MADQVHDWTNISAASGALTRTRNLNIAIRVEVVAGKAPRSQLVPMGYYAVPAMDDSQPDPVWVAQVLHHVMQLAIWPRPESALAYLGNEPVGAIAPADINGEKRPLCQVFPLRPEQVRKALNGIVPTRVSA